MNNDVDDDNDKKKETSIAYDIVLHAYDCSQFNVLDTAKRRSSVFDSVENTHTRTRTCTVATEAPAADNSNKMGQHLYDYPTTDDKREKNYQNVLNSHATYTHTHTHSKAIQMFTIRN